MPRRKWVSPVQDRHSPATVTSHSGWESENRPLGLASCLRKKGRLAISRFDQALRHHADALLVAAGFLTVVPVPAGQSRSRTSLAEAVAYFPVVGALLGSFVAGLDSAYGHVFPRPVASAMDLMLFAALTGGMHLDGLMDSLDGLFGGHDRERRLEIMRDSRVGSFGVIGALQVLLLEYAALSTLAGQHRAAALIAAPTLGRWSMALAVWAFPYARETGRGTAFKTGLSAYHVVQAGCWTLLIVSAVGCAGVRLVAITAVAVLILGRWIRQRLGGLTGDTYGAACEIATALTFVLCAAGAV